MVDGESFGYLIGYSMVLPVLLYPPVSSNVASWKILALNGGFFMGKSSMRDVPLPRLITGG